MGIDNPSWSSIDSLIHSFACKIKIEQAQFDTIIALSRGGLVPGVILSHKLNLPLVPVDYSSNRGKGDNIGQHENKLVELPKDSRVLIVDDICDSGFTLSELVEHYEYYLYDTPKTYSIYLREESVFTPTYHSVFVKGNNWVNFPWEV